MSSDKSLISAFMKKRGVKQQNRKRERESLLNQVALLLLR